MSNSDILQILIRLFAVVVLVLANGFFVAAEFALVAIRRSRIEQLLEEGHPRAKNLHRAVQHLDAYLAATQLGITMSSLGLGWLGEPAIAALIEPLLHTFLPERLASVGSHTLSVAIAFSIITSLHIVLGELAPKSLALQRPEGTALFVVQLLELYLAIFRPVVQFLNSLGNRVLRLLGLEAGGSEELIHSPEEIRLLVSASRQAGLLGEVEEDVVERILDLNERRISAFMTPRREVVWLDIEDPIPSLQRIVTNSVHSHFPVCRGSIDDLLGFITAKQFLSASLDGALTMASLSKLLSPPLYIPESTRTIIALEQFKSTGNHTAAIVDEYGAIQGLVTLNDILEAIVGDIRTGNEPEEPRAIQCSDGSWLLDGMLSVEDFKDLFEIRDLPGEEGIEYQTLGGFVLSQLGHIPVVAESFEWDRLSIEVVDMDENRIDKVLVRPIVS
ncbi:hemolysin family protein [Kovacikia minuta CCNUW1]|uniref:hemolysin family protein n=1 Tax=Kovacikia minuta TaxID=2931930 RepID=UPI001CCF6939|nr:hemolysin family protein [Kovacikia minuta]UBF28265.1 hemolysin family protein [Kovacikia minuta CCNUW1]